MSLSPNDPRGHRLGNAPSADVLSRRFACNGFSTRIIPLVRRGGAAVVLIRDRPPYAVIAAAVFDANGSQGHFTSEQLVPAVCGGRFIGYRVCFDSTLRTIGEARDEAESWVRVAVDKSTFSDRGTATAIAIANTTKRIA